MNRDDLLDAAVVGYGPVGAMLANLLGARGWRLAVFDSTTSVYHLPRAAHFDGETMRVFQAAGLAESIVPCTAPIAGMHFVNAQGRKLFGYDAPQGRGPQGWAGNSMFYQPELERALRRGADRFDNVDVQLGREIVGATQREEHAELQVHHLETNTDRTVRARYVLGCDGARSITRNAAGIGIEDLRFDQPWLVVDTVLTRPVDLPTVSVQYCDPARPCTYVPMAGSHRRWEFMLSPDEVPGDMERPERVRELLRPWVGPEDVEVVRAVVYTFHALIARPWRNRKLFVVGDAAHQMPPFLGQGMCAGIRDAHNLAWKLDLVLDGRAHEDLLDTYEHERAPHVRTIIETAVNAGRLIQTTDPAVAATRDAHFLRGAHDPPERGAVGGTNEHVGVRMPGLAGGVLSGRREPPVGQLLSQPTVDGPAGEVLLDELCGPGFAVVGGVDPRPAMTPAANSIWERARTAFVCCPGLSGWLATAGAEYVVLRPDRYVFGVARAPGDLDGLARELARHLGR